jgi:hypothetical protein
LQTENDGQEMLLWLGERSTVTPLFRHAKALKSQLRTTKLQWVHSIFCFYAKNGPKFSW